MSSELKDKITKIFGWKSLIVEKEIDRLIESIKVEEYNRCVKLTLQILLDHINLPVSELYERVQRNKYSTGDTIKE